MDIFVSYSHKDKDYVMRLVDALEQRGFQVWTDQQIDYGRRWFPEISKALRTCLIVVVLMTPDAEESEWVEKEILIAKQQNKPIIPILLRGQPLNLLIDTHYLDVRGGELPSEAFYETVSSHLPRPKAWIITFGLNVFDLLDNNKLLADNHINDSELYDWLENDLEERVLLKTTNFKYTEATSRTGETLSVRMAFPPEILEENLDFDLGWWEILEIAPIEDVYPDNSPDDNLLGN